MKVLLYLFGWVLSFVPTKLLESFATFLAFFIFDVLRVRRKTILKNLDIAFKDEYKPSEKLNIGRKSVYHFILTVFEFLVSVRTTIDENVDVEGKEKLDLALSRRKRVPIFSVLIWGIGRRWELHFQTDSSLLTYW